MKMRQAGWVIFCGLGLAALPCAATTSEAPSAPATANTAPAADAPADASKASKDSRTPAFGTPRKSHRLKFRGPDGTCACDCASGGISEADIRKAEEAHKSASR